MMERLRRDGVTLVGRQFKYRLLAPACGSQQISASRDLSASAVEVSVHDQTGVRTASGSVTKPRPTDE